MEITTINLKKPTMDDVFVFYTGRELRDEGAAPARGMHLQPRGR
jgi:ABC-2 type transport system ATP-binding protein